jgi:hypothetical protein
MTFLLFTPPSVIIDNFNSVRIPVVPDKADTILPVDANAVLAGAVSLEFFQVIAARIFRATPCAPAGNYSRLSMGRLSQESDVGATHEGDNRAYIIQAALKAGSGLTC